MNDPMKMTAEDLYQLCIKYGMTLKKCDDGSCIVSRKTGPDSSVGLAGTVDECAAFVHGWSACCDCVGRALANPSA